MAGAVYKEAGYNGVAISLPAIESLIDSLQKGSFPPELGHLYPDNVDKLKVRDFCCI
jgi:hypothetical protein